MRRTNVFKLKPTPQQREELLNRLRHTSLLFNEANYQKRQAFFNGERIPSQFSQCKSLKTSENWKAIGTGSSQELMAKVSESWRSYSALKRKGVRKKDGTAISPPRYWKDRWTKEPELKSLYCRNDCYSIRGRKLRLPKGLSIMLAGTRKWEGKQGRLEIRHTPQGFYAYQAIEAKDVLQKPHGKSMSIDLGCKNLIAASTEKGKTLLFSGRGLLSDCVYIEKKLAKAKSKLPEGKRTSRRVGSLHRKRRLRQRHAYQSAAKTLVEFAKKEGINRLYIGDITKIAEAPRLNRQANQTTHNFWNYGQLLHSINNKAEEAGIGVELVEESYSSRTCPKCGDARKGNRRSRGMFRCKYCGYTNNADIVGAINIGRKVSGRRNLTSSGEKTLPLLYLWSGNSWKQT